MVHAFFLVDIVIEAYVEFPPSIVVKIQIWVVGPYRA